MIAGMDEAGRGPCFGPMVLAGVAAEDPAIFQEWGCKDSKPKKREALHRQITREPGVRVEVRTVSAEAIDHERTKKGLNQIELVRFRDIARTLGAAQVIVDAADVDAERFGRLLKRGLKGITVVSEHKADVHHPIVGAASIVAKVERDAAVAKYARRLERKLGMPLGSGYSHDPLTIAFLTEWFARFGDVPDGTRRSWATIRDLVAPKPVPLDHFVGAIVERTPPPGSDVGTLPQPAGGAGGKRTPPPRSAAIAPSVASTPKGGRGRTK
jgi:ribonuclease HII